jgi:hypothetical protein
LHQTGIYATHLQDTGATWPGLHVLWDLFIHLAFTLSLFGASQVYTMKIIIHFVVILNVYNLFQAIMTIMWGPALGLKAADADIVLYVARNIRKQRRNVLIIGACTLSSMYFACIAYLWNAVPTEVACSITIVFLAGYWFTIVEGIGCYNAFHPESKDMLTHNDIFKFQYSITQQAYERIDKLNQGTEQIHGKATVEEPEHKKTELELAKTNSKIKMKGNIFWRTPFADGGRLTLRYGVLKNGMLDLYKAEEDYVLYKNPINVKPFNLWDYCLQTDYTKFPKGLTSVRKSIQKRTTGQGEFSVAERFASEYNLKEAALHYRFVMYPKVFSELSPLETGDFMCGNEEEYAQWTEALETVIHAYCVLDQTEFKVADTLKSTTDVTMIVQAANI